MKSIINNSVEVATKRTISAIKAGQSRRDFETTASTWGQLKRELINNGFDLSNTRVTEGNTQIDLVNDDALLPSNISRRGQITNDLIIVITPQEKFKSGMDITKASYKELKAAIKELCNNEETKEEAKKHFGNYTQMSTENMKIYLSIWYEDREMEEKFNHLKKANKVSKTNKNLKLVKLDKVAENLENGKYKEDTKTCNCKSINKEVFNEALNYILYALNLLQNEMHDGSELLSDEEIEAMIK